MSVSVCVWEEGGRVSHQLILLNNYNIRTFELL